MLGCSVLLLASVVSTLGGTVFGYELGIISGALLQLQAEFKLSCVQQEALVSALLVGSLLGSVVGGCLIDQHGRRNSILLSNVLILAGSLLLLRSSYLTLVVGRIIVGFAMCISSMACCIFVSEMVTAKRRGMLVTLYEAGITVGILAAYTMNYVLSDTSGGWKVMFGLAIVPTLVQFVSILFLPSSNDETSSHRDFGQTERGLMSLNGNQDLDDTEPSVNRLDKNKEYNIMYLFQRRDNMRTRTVIGLGLVMFQQFTGQPNVLFYACTIFQSVGFQSSSSAVLASVGLGAVKVIATVISMMLADRVGRRPLLLGGCSVMSVCLITIGLLSGRAVLSTEKPCDSQDLIGNATMPHLILDNHTVFDNESHILFYGKEIREVTDNGIKQIGAASTDLVVALPPDAHGRVVNWIILICMMAVVSAFSIGFGPMTWLVLSEIFPAAVRGRAFAFINCFNCAANLIVTFSFLNVIDFIGLSGTFLLYGLAALVAIVFFYFMLPETKGKSLAEIDKELSLNRIHSSEECCGFISRKITSVKYQRVHSQASSSGL